MNQHDLQTLSALLGCRVLDDPLVALASAVQWLCPDLSVLETLRQIDTFSLEDAYEYDDGVLFAMLTAREHYPHIYKMGMAALLRGESYDRVSDRLLTDYNDLLTGCAELDWLCNIQWGIPFLTYGFDFYDADWWAGHMAYAEIIEQFGFSVARMQWEREDSHEVVGQIIASLLHHLGGEGGQAVPDGPYKDLLLLIGWLFGETGNGLVDLNYEIICESGMNLPGWSPDDVDFMNVLQEEADDMMDSAIQGKRFLDSNPQVMEALAANIRRVQEDLDNGQNVRLERVRWPDIGT